MIRVESLEKHYSVHKRPPGIGAALRSLFFRKYETVRAVDGVSFTIERGERVGFLGPNGAGKTTTLKVLSGVLHPTSGTVQVDGYVPHKREHDFLRSITLVMGQKQQLLWDLPPSETFELNRAIYGVSKRQFDEMLAELTQLLALDELVDKPARQLSLGERMKCELVAALLHRPKTLFLDEPTIGLDVSMQVAIRGFIREYNERFDATVILTSHYMDDVVALCPRVIVIDGGKLIYDGDLRALVRNTQTDKRIGFTSSLEISPEELARLGTVVQHNDAGIELRVRRGSVRDVVSHCLTTFAAADLTIEDPPLEEVLRQLFAKQSPVRHSPASDGDSQ